MSAMMFASNESRRLSVGATINRSAVNVTRNDTGVATVISFADIVDQYHVTYDNKVDDKFHIKSWEQDNDDVSITFDRDDDTCSLFSKGRQIISLEGNLF